MTNDRARLTDRQRFVLRFVSTRIEEAGRAPSVQEIADEIGVSFASAYLNLDSLARKGYLRREVGVHRAITVLRHEKD